MFFRCKSISETWLTEFCLSSFVALSSFVFCTCGTTGEVSERRARLYVSQRLKQVQVEVKLRNFVVVYLLERVRKELFILLDLNLPSLKWRLEPISDTFILPSDKCFLDCFHECAMTS